MKDPICEKVLIAMMAAADGESSSVSAEEINAHLSACEECRDQSFEMQQVGDIFRQASRREIAVDLWPAIEIRLEQKPPRTAWQPFAVVGALRCAGAGNILLRQSAGI